MRLLSLRPTCTSHYLLLRDQATNTLRPRAWLPRHATHIVPVLGGVSHQDPRYSLIQRPRHIHMAKRKRQAAGAQGLTALETPESLPAETSSEPTLSRSARRGKLKEVTEIALAAVKDEINVHVVQNGQVVRASRAAKKQELGVAVNRRALGANDDERGDENAGDKVKEESSSPLSDLSTAPSPGRVTTTKTASARRPKKENNAEAHPSTKVSALTADIKKEDEVGQELVDPEAEDEETATPAEEIEAALTRPPPVNSDYLPLPWKGRLGYVSSLGHLFLLDLAWSCLIPKVSLLIRLIGMPLHLSSLLQSSGVLL